MVGRLCYPGHSKALRRWRQCGGGGCVAENTVNIMPNEGIGVLCWFAVFLTIHVKTADDVLRFRLRFLYNVIMKQ